MANPYGSQYQQNMGSMPPIQTHNPQQGAPQLPHQQQSPQQPPQQHPHQHPQQPPQQPPQQHPQQHPQLPQHPQQQQQHQQQQHPPHPPHPPHPQPQHPQHTQHPQQQQQQQHPPHPQPHPQPQQHQQTPRPFSPPSYQQSPGPMSPSMGGVPPAKRQRVSPNPQSSPYNSPFSASPYPPMQSPYSATSPPNNQYLTLPQSPQAPYPPQQSFHQPQPYQQPNEMTYRPPQSSMPPPKVPASKVSDNTELEKANPRDMDVNNISDVLTGSGIDLRAEEELMSHSFGTRNLGNSFNSQASGSTLSPHGSFNQWSQGAAGHGAFQGTGPMSQKPITPEQQEAELLQKHSQAARALAESSQAPLTDPFLIAGNVRQRIASRAYQNGIQVNLEGLFDRIPSEPHNVKRTTAVGSNGESIVALQADSLLNHNAPFVEILSLITLAAEERLRTILEDAFALSQGRQNTSHGVVPPNLVDLAQANGNTQPTTATPTNISKTVWEAPDSAISPLTVAGSTRKHKPLRGLRGPISVPISSPSLDNPARLPTPPSLNTTGRLPPTPPSEPSPTPQPTIVFSNSVAAALKRKVDEDFKYERARVAKRQKRLAGAAGIAAEIPVIAPMMPEKMSKKERDRLNKIGQTDEVLHRKANETASMALGGKKKYSWMTGGSGRGGGGFGSGASTPKPNTAVGGPSGANTPAQPQVDRALQGKRRTYGAPIETEDIGRRVQLRDLVHVLELDGKQRKTLCSVLARLKSTDKDEDDDPNIVKIAKRPPPVR